MTECRDQFTDREFEAPQGVLEASVSCIHAEILGIDRYGRTDSIYDFGGTSLQGIRICARIERETGYKALPVWLFEAEVMADFVKRLEAEGGAASE